MPWGWMAGRRAAPSTGRSGPRRRTGIGRDEMPRRGNVPKREVVPDPVYQSPLVTRFINSLMKRGKKSVAETAFYGAMDMVRERTDEDAMKVFRKAVDNARPNLIPRL